MICSKSKGNQILAKYVWFQTGHYFGMLILYYIQYFAAVRHYIVFFTGVQLSATSFNFIKGLFE